MCIFQTHTFEATSVHKNLPYALGERYWVKYDPFWNRLYILDLKTKGIASRDYQVAEREEIYFLCQEMNREEAAAV